MKKTLIAKSGILCALLLVTLYACVHELPVPKGSTGTGSGGGGGTTPAPVTCSADTVYFQNTILPLLNSSCAMSGCHDAITHKEGINLTSYSSIMSTGGVKPGKPGQSKLYSVIADNSMPPKGSTPLTADQKALISKWISQGALNNVCNGCDTSAFTFAGSITPMMNTYCKGCHNSSNLSAGIDLSSYAGIKAVAVNGKLMGSITHASGFVAMPQGGAALSSCQITQVQKWINAGTPNN
jgi:hypothetical protein